MEEGVMADFICCLLYFFSIWLGIKVCCLVNKYKYATVPRHNISYCY